MCTAHDSEKPRGPGACATIARARQVQAVYTRATTLVSDDDVDEDSATAVPNCPNCLSSRTLGRIYHARRTKNRADDRTDYRTGRDCTRVRSPPQSAGSDESARLSAGPTAATIHSRYRQRSFVQRSSSSTISVRYRMNRREAPRETVQTRRRGPRR